MQHFTINGVERTPLAAQTESFHELIAKVQDQLTGDHSLISSIRVNGIEIGEHEEKALAEVRLSDLESVEITLAHPREMAEETLQTLILFSGKLSDLSLQAADELEATPVNNASYHRLIDGIKVFVETVDAVKSILRVGILPPINVLEVDLVSVMKDLLQAVQSGDAAYRSDLLRTHIPGNLNDWATQGIPTLIRSRDS
jgi:hypothetical protein